MVNAFFQGAYSVLALASVPNLAYVALPVFGPSLPVYGVRRSLLRVVLALSLCVIGGEA